jgi:hypothetical protein
LYGLGADRTGNVSSNGSVIVCVAVWVFTKQRVVHISNSVIAIYEGFMCHIPISIFKMLRKFDNVCIEANIVIFTLHYLVRKTRMLFHYYVT